MRLKGWGSPNSNEGSYTVVLYIYKYFVRSPLPLCVAKTGSNHLNEEFTSLHLKSPVHVHRLQLDFSAIPVSISAVFEKVIKLYAFKF